MKNCFFNEVNLKWLLILVIGALSYNHVYGSTDQDPVPSVNIPPVKLVKHVERAGADYYQYDWPVNPGAWPTVNEHGELQYACGVWSGGFSGGVYYKSLADWWRNSGFTFAEMRIHVDHTATADDIAAILKKYLLDPAGENGGRISIHWGDLGRICGLNKLAGALAAIRDNPGLGSYDPQDEPGTGKGGNYYLDKFKTIRAIDPEHPIRLNTVPGQDLSWFVNRLNGDKPDIIGMDWYPLMYYPKKNISIRTISKWAKRTADNARHYRVMSCFINGCFGTHTATRKEGYPWWPGYAKTFPREIKNGRLPTITEMRNEVYQCVIAGIQQLMWFYYEEWLAGDYKRPDLHAEMVRLNLELRKLTGPIYSEIKYPVHIEGDKAKYEDRDFHAVASIYRNAMYVFVCSLAESSPSVPVARKGVKIMLTDVSDMFRGRFASDAEVIFDRAGYKDKDAGKYHVEQNRKTRTIAVNQKGYIVDNFSPYEVHIYRIELIPKHRNYK